jgi:4-amino-4-deoxy-L-arabinose transferase-like glycosyltransferase
VKPKSADYKWVLSIAAWTLLAATTAIVLWARIRLAGLPLERDEGEYAYGGQLLLRDFPPYKLAYSMKFPGTAAVYAVFLSTFGQSSIGIRIGLIVANLITVGLIYFLGQSILCKIGGIAAAASYSVLSLMPHVLGTAAHATHFVVLFAVAGTVVLLKALDRQSSAVIAASGCLFGIALLMKQPGILFVLFGALYLFVSDWRANLATRRIFCRNAAFILGASLPCLVVGLTLWMLGVFETFWFWTIQYASQYGSQVSVGEGLEIFAARWGSTLGTAWPIWIMGAVGLLLSVLNASMRPRVIFLALFMGFAALAVCAGFYFRPHYFILLLPAVSLLTGAALTVAFGGVKPRSPGIRFAALVLFAACLGWPLWSERDFFFQRPLVEASRMVNGTNPFLESIKIADYIRNQSTPTDTIAVLGSEPQIYFYARRLSATGYIYTYSLMEPQPYAHQMQLEMIHEIEQARPRFLVLVGMNRSWLASADSDQTIFTWANAYSESDYDEIGLINIFDRGTDYYFGPRPAGVMPAAEHILIYRRRS